jgi:hypothetical protein
MNSKVKYNNHHNYISRNFKDVIRRTYKMNKAISYQIKYVLPDNKFVTTTLNIVNFSIHATKICG